MNFFFKKTKMTFNLLCLWLLTGQRFFVRRPVWKLKGESFCSQDVALERTAMLAQSVKFLLSTLLILLEFYFPLSLIFFKGLHFPTLYWFLYSNVFHVSLLKPDNFITCLQGGLGAKKKEKRPGNVSQASPLSGQNTCQGVWVFWELHSFLRILCNYEPLKYIFETVNMYLALLK